MTEIDAVKAAQRMLTLGGRAISVDGDWGSRSSQAFQNANIGTQANVRSVLAEASLTPEALNDRLYPRMTGSGSIKVKDAEELAEKIGRQLGMVDYIDAIKKLLAFENPVIKEAGGDAYPTALINKLGYRGLAQADKRGKFWSDAREEGGGSIGPFETSWMKPEEAIKAAFLYLRRYKKQVEASVPGVNVDWRVAYLIHNQGPRGAVRILRNDGVNEVALAKQSREVRQLIGDVRGTYA